ncbi:MAG TPA: creatininase family protein [Sulfolobales archaeon]|nr:creatininase family protein [Sulfolobales archaeon]
MRSYLWGELSWKEFEETCSGKDCISVIPCGSIEQHGHHLPLGTDLYIATSLARKAVEEAWKAGYKVLLLEPIPVGVSDMWSGNPGTLWVPLEVFIAYVREYVLSVFRNNVKRIIVINSHGGNADPLKVALKSATSSLDPSYRAYLINYWEFVGDVIDSVFSNRFFHADEAETSIASALGLGVKTPGKEIPYESIQRPYSDEWHSLSLSKRPRVYFFYREGTRLEVGAFNEPGRYSVEGGEAVVRAFIDRFLALLRDIKENRL